MEVPHSGSDLEANVDGGRESGGVAKQIKVDSGAEVVYVQATETTRLPN